MFRIISLLLLSLLLIGRVSAYNDPRLSKKQTLPKEQQSAKEKKAAWKRPKNPSPPARRNSHNKGIQRQQEDVEILPHGKTFPDICPKGWGRRTGYGMECVRDD